MTRTAVDVQLTTMDLHRALVEAIGDERRVADGVSERDLHSSDMTFHRPHAPDLVVYPISTDEVSTVLALADEHRVPVTPFGSWSFDLTEEDAAALLADCPPGCVLVTHSPPKGAVDCDSGGRSLGSTAIRAAIERVSPRLVVCGHIHASAGQEGLLGATPVVNAGPEGFVRELP